MKLKFLIFLKRWYQYYIRHKWLRVLTVIFMLLLPLFCLLSGHFFRFVVFTLGFIAWRRWFCFPYKRRNVCNMVMGPPGAGKTSFLCYLTLRANALGSDVYSNVAIKDTYKFSWAEDFGNFLIEDGVLFIDEAALEDGLNNREYSTNFNRKNGTFRKLECLKLHRHFRNEIWLFSQADDADLKVRELCQSFWIVRKFLPWLVHIKLYTTDIDLDPMTQDFRKVRVFKRRYFLFTPVCWLFFDTEEVPFTLQNKEFEFR